MQSLVLSQERLELIFLHEAVLANCTVGQLRRSLSLLRVTFYSLILFYVKQDIIQHQNAKQTNKNRLSEKTTTIHDFYQWFWQRYSWHWLCLKYKRQTCIASLTRNVGTMYSSRCDWMFFKVNNQPGLGYNLVYIYVCDKQNCEFRKHTDSQLSAPTLHLCWYFLGPITHSPLWDSLTAQQKHQHLHSPGAFSSLSLSTSHNPNPCSLSTTRITYISW